MFKQFSYLSSEIKDILIYIQARQNMTSYHDNEAKYYKLCISTAR